MEPEIQRFSRKCTATGRDLQPGDVYYSVLTETPEGVQRCDYAREAWNGPPPECFSWWKSRIPQVDPNRIRWAADSVLLDYLENCLANRRWDVANVLALALARRRLLNIDYPPSPQPDSLPGTSQGSSPGTGADNAPDILPDTGNHPEDDLAENPAATPANREELILTVKATGDSHRIPAVDLGNIDVASIQAELDQHLFTDQPEEPA